MKGNFLKSELHWQNSTDGYGRVAELPDNVYLVVNSDSIFIGPNNRTTYRISAVRALNFITALGSHTGTIEEAQEAAEVLWQNWALAQLKATLRR